MSLASQEFSTKILKIKNKISNTNDYLQLQSVIQNFQKLKRKFQTKKFSNQYEGQQSVRFRQLRQEMFRTCQMLIKEKMKYFKKIAVNKMKSQKLNTKNSPAIMQSNTKNKQSKMLILDQSISSDLYSRSNEPQSLIDSKQFKELRQLSQKEKQKSRGQQPFSGTDSPSNNRTSKRLKQSKSVDNFSDKIKESFTFRDESNLGSKISQPQFSNKNPNFKLQPQFSLDDDKKTQIKAFGKKPQSNLYDQPQSFLQDLQYYKNKVNFLQQALKNRPQSSESNYMNQNSRIFDHYHFKLRQKSLELQELKGRIKYHEQTSHQMRTRVLNQQRRYEDYTSSLKEHIRQQEQELFTINKQKKLLTELVKEMEFKIKTQQQQSIKHLQQIQSFLKEKEKFTQSSLTKHDDLKKQLQVMSRQESYIKELEKLLRQGRIETDIQAERTLKLQQEYIKIKDQLENGIISLQTMEQLLEMKLLEIQDYKIQIVGLKRNIVELEQELQQTDNQLHNLRRDIDDNQKKKDKANRKKIQNLKEVKELLEQDILC